MAAATHARIYFSVGGGVDTLDVQETLDQLVTPNPPSPLFGATPRCWVTDAQGNRIWVNTSRIVRIEPK